MKIYDLVVLKSFLLQYPRASFSRSEKFRPSTPSSHFSSYITYLFQQGTHPPTHPHPHNEYNTSRIHETYTRVRMKRRKEIRKEERKKRLKKNEIKKKNLMPPHWSRGGASCGGTRGCPSIRWRGKCKGRGGGGEERGVEKKGASSGSVGHAPARSSSSTYNLSIALYIYIYIFLDSRWWVVRKWREQGEKSLGGWGLKRRRKAHGARKAAHSNTESCRGALVHDVSRSAF